MTSRYCLNQCDRDVPPRPVNFWAPDLTPQQFDALLVEPGTIAGISPSNYRTFNFYPFANSPCPLGTYIFYPQNLNFYIPN